MVWPIDNINLTHLDQGTDKPSLARSDLLNLANIVKQMLLSEPLSVTGNKMNLSAQPDPGWGANVSVIQLTSGGFVFGADTITMGVYGAIWASGIAQGAYYDGTTWRYAQAGKAASMQAIGGVKSTIMFGTAQIGTNAGDPITWTFRSGNPVRGASYYQDTTPLNGSYPGPGLTAIGGGVNTTYTKMTFKGQSYDTDGLMAVAKDRFTVPAGVSWIRLSCGVQGKSNSATGNGPFLMMTKNRSPAALATAQDGAMIQDGIVGGFFGRSNDVVAYTTKPHGGGETAPIQVVTGDYFELWVSSASTPAGTIDIMDEGTWFAMEILK